MEKEKTTITMLRKMHVNLVDSDQKSFAPGDIISKGNETKISTFSSGILNVKSWGYTRKEIVISSISEITGGQLTIATKLEGDKIVGFHSKAEPAIKDYEAGPNFMKIEASTGHKDYNLPNISEAFVKLFLSKEGGIRVTNVAVFKTPKGNFVPKLNENSCVITKPVFNRNKHSKK